MKARVSRPPRQKTPSQLIDAMVKAERGWKGRTLSTLRRAIREADPCVREEVKWRKPSNPDGVPVWSHDGILCVGNVLKNAVRLTFPDGAQIQDPAKLFNTRLDSRTVRAIDVHEDEAVNVAALGDIVRAAVRLNQIA